MAFNGVVWNESIPTNSDLAAEIDDYMRDIKLAVRSRMALEHGWPSAQTGTNNAGFHTFITLSAQTGTPVLTYGGVTTQFGAIWASSGTKSIMVTDSAGNNHVLLASGKGIGIVGAFYSSTGTQGDMLIGTSGGTIKVLAASAPGYVLVSNTSTADPTYVDPATFGYPISNTSNLRIQYGSGGTIGEGATGAVTYTTVFSVAPVVTITPNWNPSGAADESAGMMSISGVTTTGFNVHNTDNTAKSYSYIAIGSK